MKYEVIMTGIHVDYRAPWLFAWPKKVSKIVTTIRHCFFFLLRACFIGQETKNITLNITMIILLM